MSTFKKGDEVHHPKYGPGVVVQVQGSTFFTDYPVEVHFEQEGNKVHWFTIDGAIFKSLDPSLTHINEVTNK